MIWEKLTAGVKIILFLLIGSVIFMKIQNIMIPDLGTKNIEHFYTLKEDSVDAITLGTSHMINAYSPEEVYEQYGLSTYNLGTSGQSIESSYYLTVELLKTQKPQVIILDASSLFFDDSGSVENWRRVMDVLNYSENKYEMSKDFIDKFPEEEFLSAIFPIYQYHTRWNELGKSDFRSGLEEYSDFGNYLGENIHPPQVSKEEMNNLTNRSNENYNETVWVEGEKEEIERNIGHDYEVEITEANKSYLRAIRDLCNANGIKFLLIKIPVIQDPEVYTSAWTELRSNYVKELCEEYSINYLDLLYDNTEYALNYETDFLDGGGHLNVRGMINVSGFLGKYLIDEYGLSAKKNEELETKKVLYDEKRDLALIRTESDFLTYFQRVLQYKGQNWDIFITGTANMLSSINDDYKAQLASLGLQTDFNQYTQGAYLAYIENDTVPYEAYSSLTASYDCPLEDDTMVHLEATGRENSWYTSITFPFTDEDGNAVNFTRHDSSLTIVVYSPEDEEILDSAYFILNEDGTVSRVWQ
ncbi:hypothetical protein K280104A7_13820 [Candidatus Bariatricus faecipullorum]